MVLPWETRLLALMSMVLHWMTMVLPWETRLLALMSRIMDLILLALAVCFMMDGMTLLSPSFHLLRFRRRLLLDGERFLHLLHLLHRHLLLLRGRWWRCCHRLHTVSLLLHILHLVLGVSLGGHLLHVRHHRLDLPLHLQPLF